MEASGGLIRDGMVDGIVFVNLSFTMDILTASACEVLYVMHSGSEGFILHE